MHSDNVKTVVDMSCWLTPTVSQNTPTGWVYCKSEADHNLNKTHTIKKSTLFHYTVIV